MFDTLKRLYKNGKLNKIELNNAVKKGWITAEEVKKIIESVENE